MSTGIQKQFNGALLGGLFASLICANGIVGAATETESNDTKEQAQSLVITDTGATVSAMMGSAPGASTTDLDIYSFEAKAGDVPSIMVVSDGMWDPLVVLYDAYGTILDMNDDAYPMNPGSTSELDSRVDAYKLLSDGRYFIAVTPVPRYLGSSFHVDFPDAGSSGSYTLVVQGVTPPVVVSDPEPTPTPDPTPVPDPVSTPDPTPVPRVVTIKVKHWEEAAKRGMHPIDVTIMSAADFDATTIDPTSLKFGATGEEKSLMRCEKRDPKARAKELVCRFNSDIAGFKEGDVQALLKGSIVNNGGQIEASAALPIFRVASEKSESWHKRHHINPRGAKYHPRKVVRAAKPKKK